MKRLMTLLSGFAAVLLLVTSSVWMQPQSQTSTSEILSHLGLLENPRAGYISNSTRHKLIIEQGDLTAYAELKNSQSIVEEFHYDSFKMVIVDEYASGGLEHLLRMQATIRDDMNLIHLGGYEMDTTAPEATLNQLPVELRQTDMADAMARGTQPKGGLYIVQFVGPIQQPWLDALEGTGAEVVSYLSANAYVVSANKRAAAKLIRLKNKKSFVQFLGDYEPAFRLSASLQKARTMTDQPAIDVLAQVFEGARAESSLSKLRDIAGDFIRSYRVLNHRVVEMRVAPSRLDEIARMEAVFGVKEMESSPSSLAAESQLSEAGARGGNLEGDSMYDEYLNRSQQPSPAMRRAEQAISGLDQTGRFTLDQTQVLSATGKTYHLSGRIVDGGKPTRFALAWTSPPKTASSGGLVNDLDLEVRINGATYKGNVFAEGVSVRGGRADSLNEVEVIILPAGMEGEFTLTVRGANLAGDGVSGKGGSTDQDFALAVVNAAVCPSVSVSPFSFDLTAVEGFAAVFSESISVSSNPSGVGFTAQPDPFSSWISVGSCGFCQTPGSVSFRAPSFGLSRGFYSGSVEIRVGGECSFSQRVPVFLNVVPPIISVSPTSLSFIAPVGGPNPANKSFTISTNANFIGWSLSSNASWLTASPTSGTAARSSTVSVGVNVAGLAPGTYTGAITVTSPGASNSPRTMTVTLNVATPVIGVNPTSLSFATGVGGANPASKTISIFNTGVGTLNWTATDNKPWITVSPTSGTAPSTLTVSINKAGLAVGTHTGTVTITAAGASNSPLNIPITLTISSTPVIEVSPASLTFAARQGVTPPPKTVSITNAGGGTLNWSASSNASWLLVSPASGTAPSTLTVSINPSGLGVGTHTGTITITAPGASPVTISVTFGVIEPLPQP